MALDYYALDGKGKMRKWNEETKEWEMTEKNSHPGVTLMDKVGSIAETYPEKYVLSFEQGPVQPEPIMSADGYKYNEDKYVAEIGKYIDSTYDQHYSHNKFQATEFIIDGGHGTGFCIGNVLKYAQRYGRKGNPDDWRKDLMKVIHYAIIQLHVHDQENSKGETK